MQWNFFRISILNERSRSPLLLDDPWVFSLWWNEETYCWCHYGCCWWRQQGDYSSLFAKQNQGIEVLIQSEWNCIGLSDLDGVKAASGLLNIMQKMHDWVWFWRSLGSFAQDWSRDWGWSFHGRRVSWWGKWWVFFLIVVLFYIFFWGDGLSKFSAKYPSFWVDNIDPLCIGNIFKFGLPRVIVTDNGKPFDNNQLEGFLQPSRDIESLHNISKLQIISTKTNFILGLGTLIARRLQ